MTRACLVHLFPNVLLSLVIRYRNNPESVGSSILQGLSQVAAAVLFYTVPNRNTAPRYQIVPP